MAVEWVDPDDLTAVAGTEARSADFNSVLQDLKYLADPPRCAVRLTADQSIANSTDVAIDWDEVVWDSHGDMWDDGAPSRITITRPGVYFINTSLLWEENDVNRRAIFFEVNGGVGADRRRGQQQASSEPIEHQLPVITNLADGDYFEIVVRQNSGSAQDLIATRSTMHVVWIAMPPETGE